MKRESFGVFYSKKSHEANGKAQRSLSGTARADCFYVVIYVVIYVVMSEPNFGSPFAGSIDRIMSHGLLT